MSRGCKSSCKLFCRVIRPLKNAYGFARVDPKATECFVRPLRTVDLSIDAVVDYMDAFGIDLRVAGQHVVAHPMRDRNDGVSGFDCGSLTEHRQGIAAAQLLGFPGPERLEAVNGHHVGNRPHELRKMTPEVRVPRMAVHQIGALDGPRHREVDRHRLKRG